jgi:hypothetical protein
MTSAFSDAEQQPASPKLDAFARLLDAAVQLRPRLPKRVRQIELDRRVSQTSRTCLRKSFSTGSCNCGVLGDISRA